MFDDITLEEIKEGDGKESLIYRILVRNYSLYGNRTFALKFSLWKKCHALFMPPYIPRHEYVKENGVINEFSFAVDDYLAKIKKILDSKKVSYYTLKITNPADCIQVDVLFEVSNGLSGMKRDVVLRLCRLAGNLPRVNEVEREDKVRSVLGMCQEHYVWKNHAYFVASRYSDFCEEICIIVQINQTEDDVQIKMLRCDTIDKVKKAIETKENLVIDSLYYHHDVQLTADNWLLHSLRFRNGTKLRVTGKDKRRSGGWVYYVRDLEDNTHLISGDSHVTVGEMKISIRNRIGISVKKQSIVYGNVMLTDDDAELCDYDLEDQSTVFLVETIC